MSIGNLCDSYKINNFKRHCQICLTSLIRKAENLFTSSNSIIGKYSLFILYRLCLQEVREQADSGKPSARWKCPKASIQREQAELRREMPLSQIKPQIAVFSHFPINIKMQSHRRNTSRWAYRTQIQPFPMPAHNPNSFRIPTKRHFRQTVRSPSKAE